MGVITQEIPRSSGVGMPRTPDGSVRSYRGFHHYCNAFGFNPDGSDLRGKTILDMCAGDSPFAKIAAKYESRVIAGDKDYYRLKPRYPSNPVSTVAEQLPFPDKAFDEALYSFGFTWIKDKSSALHEATRVVRPGGYIKITPARFTFGEDTLPEGCSFGGLDGKTLIIENRGDVEVPNILSKVEFLFDKNDPRFSQAA